MRLQIRTTGTLSRSPARGTPTLVLSFFIGPLGVTVIANVPAEHGTSATAYVHAELKGRVLIDESNGIPEDWEVRERP